MARISGVDIPREKRLEISLTYIFGVGRTTAQQICDATASTRTPGSVTSPTKRSTASAPTSTQNLKVEGDLRREIAAGHQAQDGDRLLPGPAPPQAACPVHGQRTHTNARTRKGPKKTVAGKKKVRK